MTKSAEALSRRRIEPGSTIGILGGGQLGRMLAMAARRLGYRVHILAPESDTPAGQVADLEVIASYDDVERVREFARAVGVVTFEFENVSAAAVAAAEAEAIVRPGGRALHIAQHRLHEKAFLRDHGLPVTPFAAIRSASDLQGAVQHVGLPAVLKTAAFGYDGKGQVMVHAEADLAAAWASLGNSEAILEAFVDLAVEMSVVAARGVDGAIEAFVPFENVHCHHILDVTVAPATVSEAIVRQAMDVTRAVLEHLDYVGLLCVEFFLARDGRLLINELAPRPHNSGHLTIEACCTSQFEQQLRAVCGLPLGSPELRQPAAMVNLLGDLWTHGEPRWERALALPNVTLHLYGKSAPRPGRKMGHITALADTPEAARALAIEAREALK
ncbi:MAG: 5-(carboxyamino)imidazole ribonucleotide synthase [Vicinamibacterales bacterium]